MLNDEQQAVVNSTAHKLLCLAGAGTGKTKTLIARLLQIISQGVQPDSILVLTFTRAAAAEMRRRFESAYAGRTVPNFKTFHAFCYELLCKDVYICKLLGYKRAPEIITEESMKQLHREASTQCGLSLSLLNAKTLTAKQQNDRRFLQTAIESKCKLKNVITYDELAESISKLFIDDDPIVQKYKMQYRHIFVDEFQDTTPHEAKFLESFTQSDLFVVGDVLQNIYSFRGTTSEIIKHYTMSEEWETHKLHTNYRSTKEICEFANSNTHYIDNAYRVEIQSTRSGSPVNVCKFPMMIRHEDMEQINKCCELVPKLGGSTAILCRTNKEVAAVTSHLRQCNISTNTKSEELNKLLMSLTDREFMIDWILSDTSNEQCFQYILQTYCHPDVDRFELLAQLFLESTQHPGQRISEILNIQQSLYEHKFEEVVEYLKSLNPQIVIDNIDRFDTSDELIEALMQANSQILENSVYVGTIHSVKGLEYDNVVLLGVNGPTFIQNSEDSHNLYYVGITRAKNNLWVFMKEDQL